MDMGRGRWCRVLVAGGGACTRARTVEATGISLLGVLAPGRVMQAAPGGGRGGGGGGRVFQPGNFTL